MPNTLLLCHHRRRRQGRHCRVAVARETSADPLAHVFSASRHLRTRSSKNNNDDDDDDNWNRLIHSYRYRSITLNTGVGVRPYLPSGRHTGRPTPSPPPPHRRPEPPTKHVGEAKKEQTREPRARQNKSREPVVTRGTPRRTPRCAFRNMAIEHPSPTQKTINSSWFVVRAQSSNNRLFT